MKIFISSIDSELGYHLAESLRQDHLLLQGFSIISGTRTHSTPFVLHDSVSQTFDFTKQRDAAVKAALQSDVLIFDLRNDPAPQIEFILKVIKHSTVKHALKVIGISNFTTWSNTKTSEFAQTPSDKQALLEHATNKQHWKNSTLNKSHYPLRVPHPMFVYNYLLEQQILQLKSFVPMAQSSVICTGLLYGKSGFDLAGHIETAVNGRNDWVLGLMRDKLINEESALPVLHVDRLMEEVQSIVYGDKGQNDKTLEYNVLCEDNSKSVVNIVSTINQLCGNNKQLHEDAVISVKEQKPAVDTLKIPTASNEHPSSSTQLPNDVSSRAPTANRTRNSSDQTQSIAEPLTKIFVPELTFANDKAKFALLMNIRFSSSDESNDARPKSIKRGNKSQANETHVSREGHDDNQAKVETNKQSNSSSENKWLQDSISQFSSYYDCELKHFIISEEVLKQNEPAQKAAGNLLIRYHLIDKNTLSNSLSLLVESGIISQQRLATPQEDKKKPNNKNPIPTKQPYEIVFPQLIQHILLKNKLSHFVLCLKAELISKTLTIISDTTVEQLKNMKFISITAKLSRPNTPSYPSNPNITKSLQIFSNEFYQLYDIDNPQSSVHLEGERIQIDDTEVNPSPQKNIKPQLPQKDTDEASQSKINLLHQYLLDNLIVYLAEAKHNLKMKGKLKIGQKFEGKQNLKLFIEELKTIKTREIKLACEEQY